MTDDLTRLRRLAGMLVESKVPEPIETEDDDSVEESEETCEDTEDLAESYARFMEASGPNKVLGNGPRPRSAAAIKSHDDRFNSSEMAADIAAFQAGEMSAEDFRKKHDPMLKEAGRYSRDFTDGVPPEDREDCEDCGGTGEIEIPLSGGSYQHRTCSNCDGLGWFEKHHEHEEELDEDSLPTSGAPENSIFETEIAGLKIALYQWEDRSFSVQCGMQENAKLNYDKATVTLGKAIMFALGQEGTISK